MATFVLNNLVIKMDVTPAAPTTATLTRDLRVHDVMCYCTTAAGGINPAMTLSGPSGAITDAIAMGSNVINGVGRASTIDLAFTDVMYGANLSAALVGAATASSVWVTCVTDNATIS